MMISNLPGAVQGTATVTSVRDLDLLDYRQKTLHWLREDAWNPDGQRLRFNRQEKDVRVSTDRRGSITSVSETVIGRPCHSIITAFIRYRDAMKLVRGRGWVPASRCADCPLRESCERVVKERIKAFTPLSDAYDQWLLAEGPTSFDEPGFVESHVGRLWKRVGLAAAEAPFTSANDQALVEHYNQLELEALEADRRRKGLKREQDRRRGKIDSGHISDLEIAADDRRLQIVLAMIAPNRPPEVRQLRTQSVHDLRDVWLGREILRAQHLKCRAPDIARWIQATGRRNDSTTFPALTTRVHKDLRRITRFERLDWNGRPLLKPFDAQRESVSQVSLHAIPANPL